MQVGGQQTMIQQLVEQHMLSLVSRLAPLVLTPVKHMLADQQPITRRKIGLRGNSLATKIRWDFDGGNKLADCPVSLPPVVHITFVRLYIL